MGHSLVLAPSLNLRAAWFQVRMCVAWALLRLLVALDAVVQSMPLTSAWQLRLLANRCCSSHRPFDVVPRVLLLPEQSLQLQPCPFNMW